MATNFYLETRTDKNGDAPIRISVTIGGARFVTSTQLKISPDKWNASKQRVKKGCSNSKGIAYNAINNALQNMSSHFAAFESECISNNAKLDVESLKREFNVNFGKKPKDVPSSKKSEIQETFLDMLDRFVCESSRENDWANGTTIKFGQLRNAIKEFNEDKTAAAIDEKTLYDFVSFLKDKKQYKNTTIAKHVKLLKWALNW